jgi:hypothetical protein
VSDQDIELGCGLWARFNSLDEVHQWAADESVSDGISAWAWQWAEEGFWTLTCGHKFAAALACTNTGDGDDDLELPARALRVQLPNGLLVAGANEIRTAYLHLPDEGTCRLFLKAQGVTERFSIEMRATTVRGLLFADADVEALSEEQERLCVLARRVVVGLLYTMQHTNNFRSKSFPTIGPKHDGRGPPNHRTVFVGGTIGVDARPQVAAWLNGSKRSVPALQHIVRGHYKRQVMGVSGTGRKVIWVEPYWRGPEGAPILVHPRRIGPGEPERP